MLFPSSIHLFCRVIDNFGDIGVCWRLARQLHGEHAAAVTLWVDDLASFGKICSGIDPLQGMQSVQGVTVKRWRDDFDPVSLEETADVVIEAFACELPATYLASMAACDRKPVWINLEYLSAEPWVESCHAMPSRHPSLPLTKYFFFPGFSGKTGGLPVEKHLLERRRAFQSDPSGVQAFFADLGVHVSESARKVSLFCYPGAPIESLFDAMCAESRRTVCLVPEGVASDAVGAFLRQPARAGTSTVRDALTVHVLPFTNQEDYDKLLWACDLNFVRGEDSFVRAQWAARPFVWHIYPQDEGAHWCKLDAFLTRYKTDMPETVAEAVDAVWRAWNGAAGIGPHWHSLNSVMPGLSRHAAGWAQQVSQNDLASNLVQFVREIC